MRRKKFNQWKGFTLLELMVSMVITVILVSILINVTTMSSDTLSNAQTKVEMSRRGSKVLDQIETDIQSMVIRRDGSDWFYAGLPWDQEYGKKPTATDEWERSLWVETTANRIFSKGGDFMPPSISSMWFYTAAADRYDGFAGSGSSDDKGGDVSFLEYSLGFRNDFSQLDGTSATSLDEDPELVFYRLRADPDVAYNGLANDKNIFETFHENQAGGGLTSASDRFNIRDILATNVYSVSATFNISYFDTSSADPTKKRFGSIALQPNYENVNTTTYAPDNENVATCVRIGSNGQLHANCSKYFTTPASSTMHMNEWVPKANLANVVIESVNFSVLMIDDAGLQYLQLLNENETNIYMDRQELVDRHCYPISRLIKFPEY